MIRRCALTTAVLAALAAPAYAQTPAPPAAETKTLEQVVVTGTRVTGRSSTDTAAPVDIVGAEQISRGGTPELNQALSVSLPSFNFPRPSLTDGTDTVRPAALRGLAPDQSLVLVNGKRRHAAALVNVNGTIGRGAAAVDLNTIPMAAVQSVEVLRDGASAQYGSDAIAGVINVLLRKNDEGGGASLNYGVRDSSYTTPVTPFSIIRAGTGAGGVGGVTSGAPATPTWAQPSEVTRDVSDGETSTLSVWKGLKLGANGYLTISAEYKDQQRTERDSYDNRQQYNLVGGAYDPREATFDRFNAWTGEPELEQTTFFANAGIDLDDGARIYGWASHQDRESRSAGFYRFARDTRNVISIYPDGFLPIIAPDVTDTSAAIGTEWQWGEWYMDSSLVYGRNKMMFTIENTLNASIGPTSGTEFDAGGFDYDQLVLNFSGVRSVEMESLASALNVATGLEARREGYSIFAGEPDSWRNGGVLLPLFGPGCTSPTAAQVAAGGCATASGAQVFPGFRPGNEVDESRTAIGAYLDLEANLTEKLLGSAAVRAEHYSDFGSNLTGKLALRYDFTEHFGVRGSVQNGFRAPSPQQQFFTTTSTNFVGGIPFDIATFPVSDPVAVALGAQPLDAEESMNVSLGFVASFDRLSITVDAYRIEIDDRIVLSENLGTTTSSADQAVGAYLVAQGFVGVQGGRFFINGVDTETQGVDAVVNWTTENDWGRWDITLAGNYSETEVTRVPTTNVLSALNPAPVLFARINILTFEKSPPKDKYSANLNWTKGRWGATFRATRYGEALDPGSNTTDALDHWLGAKTLVDLEGRINLTDAIRLAVGAENVFDTYPDPFPVNLPANGSVSRTRNGTGNTPYSTRSPFGQSGRLLYARLSYDF